MPRDRSGPIAGVILAAGESSRMGRNKLFFEIIEGETLLRRAVGTAVAAGLEPVITVLGHEGERARAELAGAPTQIVINPDYTKGLAGSLKIAVAAIPPSVIGVVVMLADMPFVTPEMVMALVARYRTSSTGLVMSNYGETHAPPMLFDRALFGELAVAQGASGGKDVVERHRRDAVIVSWPPHAGMDLDTPEDLARARAGGGQDP